MILWLLDCAFSKSQSTGGKKTQFSSETSKGQLVKSYRKATRTAKVAVLEKPLGHSQHITKGGKLDPNWARPLSRRAPAHWDPRHAAPALPGRDQRSSAWRSGYSSAPAASEHLLKGHWWKLERGSWNNTMSLEKDDQDTFQPPMERSILDENDNLDTKWKE